MTIQAFHFIDKWDGSTVTVFADRFDAWTVTEAARVGGRTERTYDRLIGVQVATLYDQLIRKEEAGCGYFQHKDEITLRSIDR